MILNFQSCPSIKSLDFVFPAKLDNFAYQYDCVVFDNIILDCLMDFNRHKLFDF